MIDTTDAGRYRAVRATTERLVEPLSAEDCVVQSMPDASPAKWHLAHTTWFFETFVVAPRLPSYRTPDAAYEVLFNSYYNAVGEQYPRPHRGLLTRPGLDEVRSYRRAVDEAMHDILGANGGPDPELLRLLEIGLQHEQQHQELLLMDIKHLLSRNPLLPAYAAESEPPEIQGHEVPRSWHAVEGGAHDIGHGGDGFAFDNEGPRHEVRIAPFEIATRPVTVGEYRRFIEDGGYRRPELWLADGWAAVSERGWTAPSYWLRHGDGYRLFTLTGARAMRSAEPVCHVSFYEADAFARWSRARLPTEAEWEVVAATVALRGNFAGSGRLHPVATTSTDVVDAMYGDVWEWTASPYVAYPGFRVPDGALGEYNGKFMCNQFVLRGGCCATPPGHVRTTYRNFFYPHQRWAFGGLRLARDA